MERAQALSSSTDRLFPLRFAAWQAQGLSAHTASAAATAGCDTAEEIARLGRVYFESLPNPGEKSLQQLADLAGWPPKRRTAVDTIAASLALGMDPQATRETATDVLTSLRKARFVLAVSNRAVA
jgi:hypothetical protein